MLTQPAFRPEDAEPPGTEGAARQREPARDLSGMPPLQKGGVRKNAFSTRVHRSDPDVDLFWKLDEGGCNEKDLKIAFGLYESLAHRLAICLEQRRTGRPDPRLPLAPVAAHPCSAQVCNCEPNYRKITAPNMMGVDSDFAARWFRNRRQKIKRKIRERQAKERREAAAAAGS